MKRLAKFIRNDSGAISVDWVVLTAGVIGLALSAVVVVEAGVVERGETAMQDVAVSNGD